MIHREEVFIQGKSRLLTEIGAVLDDGYRLN